MRKVTDELTIALTKGRILSETLPLLKAAGIEPEEDIASSRKLQFKTNQAGVGLLVIRGVDVPTYVQYGSADLGVSGKDVLMEHGSEGFYEPLDLGIARCKLMTAGLTGKKDHSIGRITVATKFVNIAKRYYAGIGRQVNVIKLYGAMELAPLMGMADEIVDIVDTGNTLRANGLEPYEEIAKVSSRLIVNKASMKVKHDKIQQLINSIATAVKEKN